MSRQTLRFLTVCSKKDALTNAFKKHILCMFKEQSLYSEKENVMVSSLPHSHLHCALTLLITFSAPFIHLHAESPSSHPLGCRKIIVQSVGPKGLVVLPGGVVDSPTHIVGSEIMVTANRSHQLHKHVTHVVLKGGVEVLIEQGEEPTLTIETDSNIEPLVTTHVCRDTLVIDLEPASLTTRRLLARLTLPQLTHLTTQGVGSIHAGTLHTPEELSVTTTSVGGITIDDAHAQTIKITSSSVGNIVIKHARAEKLDASLSSVGSVTIHEGTIQDQQIKLSSIGSYNAGNVSGDTATVTCTSLGVANVNVKHLSRNCTGVERVHNKTHNE